jgi:peptidoglycan/xylan/chitin deacetylase (PgdA/CDA1 family)
MIEPAVQGQPMRIQHPWTRLQRYYKRNAASLLFRRPFAISTVQPIISFTFDDFPRSAWLTGGAILNRYGLAGTYYASLGLIGKQEPSGRIFVPADLKLLLEEGHELGCHTFSHCHSWDTAARSFERSIVDNRSALGGILPGVAFRTFSYPISSPRPFTKSMVARHFLCSRGGGQTFNAGTADLNQLSAYFLEKSRDNVQAVKQMIDRNRQAQGWLIFATHDISCSPTPFGCTPEFFEQVVRYAVGSGARILPVVKALDLLRSSSTPE